MSERERLCRGGTRTRGSAHTIARRISEPASPPVAGRWSPPRRTAGNPRERRRDALQRVDRSANARGLRYRYVPTPGGRYLGVLTVEHGELEDRVRAVRDGGCATKTQMTRAAATRRSAPFRISELERALPTISVEHMRNVLKALRHEGALTFGTRQPRGTVRARERPRAAPSRMGVGGPEVVGRGNRPSATTRVAVRPHRRVRRQRSPSWRWARARARSHPRMVPALRSGLRSTSSVPRRRSSHEC